MWMHPVSQHRLREKMTNPFPPVRLNEVDLAEAIPDIATMDPETGLHYESVRTLVRVHGYPIGVIEFKPSGSNVSADEHAHLIWSKLSSEICEHLRRDGLPPVSLLDRSGLPAVGHPGCLSERCRLLDDAPLVSVVISTRDRHESLKATLEAISRLAYPRYEVIVVDNASSNSETEMAVSQCQPLFRTLRYAYEPFPGLSSGRNRGIALAQGEIVAITDDDVAPDANWLTEIVHGFASSDRVACVTGPILPMALDTPAKVMIEQFGGFSKGFSRRVFDLGANRPDDRLYPYAAGTFGSGANIAFKTEIIRGIGGFDPALGAGTLSRSGEEFAVFLRLLRSGYQLVYEPGALIFHSHHGDYGAVKRQIYGYGVGMTAFLTKCLLDDPSLILDLFGKLPYGVLYAVNPKSRKNRSRGKGYPLELVLLDLKGMIVGPLAYLRSRGLTRSATAHSALFSPLD
jgi:GT2 family glycosyltransferase